MAGPLPISCDVVATAARYERLGAAMADEVLGPGGFCCSSAAACKASIREGQHFAEGQLSHVGDRYDLTIDDRPFRVLLVGMDTGRPDQHVTLDERREQVYGRAGERFTKRNAHMRGTTLALRSLFGEYDAALVELETLDVNGDLVHLFRAYAMANVRLCSAIDPGSTKSKGTRTMTTNCLRHLRTTLEILEPNVVVLQGQTIRAGIEPLVTERHELDVNHERVRLAGHDVQLVSLWHPSFPGPRGNWSWPAAPYFTTTVAPALRAARGAVLA